MNTKNFFEAIPAFNDMYSMPTVAWDVSSIARRLAKFADILYEEELEMREVGELIDSDAHVLDILTALADLYGDIIVYCASELQRHQIPPEEILRIIMESNASKLDEDGKPIYDSRGKLMKGPNYWKPEPKIREYLDKLQDFRNVEKIGE